LKFSFTFSFTVCDSPSQLMWRGWRGTDRPLRSPAQCPLSAVKPWTYEKTTIFTHNALNINR